MWLYTNILFFTYSYLDNTTGMTHLKNLIHDWRWPRRNNGGRDRNRLLLFSVKSFCTVKQAKRALMFCATRGRRGRTQVNEYWACCTSLCWVRIWNNPQTLMKQRVLLLEWLSLQICKQHSKQYSFRDTYVEVWTCIHSPLMINLRAGFYIQKVYWIVLHPIHKPSTHKLISN